MKLVVTIVVGLLVLLGAAFGASLVLLPGTATKVETIAIDRPPSTVYALLASMPATHKMGESLTVRVVPESIKTPADPLTVEFTTADGRKLAGEWLVSGQGMTSQAKLTLTEDLGINPLARMQGGSGAQLAAPSEAALKAIKAEAEAIGNFDFSRLNYKVENVSPMKFIYISATTSQQADIIKDSIRKSLNLVRTAFADNNLTPSGLPIAVETAWKEDSYGFQAGLPYEGPTPLNLIGVTAGETPSGPAVIVDYYGAEADIIPVYDQMETLMAATRVQRGASMEVYKDDPTQPGGSQKRQIVYFIRDGNAALISKVAPPFQGTTLPSGNPAALPPPQPAAIPATPEATATPVAPTPTPAEPAKTEPAPTPAPVK